MVGGMNFDTEYERIVEPKGKCRENSAPSRALIFQNKEAYDKQIFVYSLKGDRSLDKFELFDSAKLSADSYTFETAVREVKDIHFCNILFKSEPPKVIMVPITEHQAKLVPPPSRRVGGFRRSRKMTRISRRRSRKK